MKVLTMCEPFATLVALGLKRYETRPQTISWRNYRGPVAIHAGLSKAWFKAPQSRAAMEALREHGFKTIADFPLGQIIAVTEILSVTPTVVIRERLNDFELSVGGYGPQRLAIELGLSRLLANPIKAPGALYLWEYPVAENVGVSE